jgi:integral membrane protein (TIGR01906 family)
MVFPRALATGIFLVCIPIALVTLNVRYAFNEGRLWDYGFDRYDVEQRTGLSRYEIDQAALQLRNYFNDDRDRLDITVLTPTGEEPLFNDREVIHLADVKDLLRGVYRLQELTLAYILLFVVGVFLWARQSHFRGLARLVLPAAIATIALLASFGVVAAVGFDDLFRQFHVVSFSNDFWQLDPASDRLIQMFPQPFWSDATFFVGALSIAEALLLGATSYLYLRATRPRLAFGQSGAAEGPTETEAPARLSPPV